MQADIGAYFWQSLGLVLLRFDIPLASTKSETSFKDLRQTAGVKGRLQLAISRRFAMRRRSIILVLVLFAGCSQSGPAITHASSSQFPSLQEKTDFLQRYVSFRRTYEALDFRIDFFNGGGGVPAPSEWDVRLVARVPTSEIQVWVPQGITQSSQDRDWLKLVPTTLEIAGITEWYGEKGRVVGIDREHGIVAYHLWKY